MSPEPFYITTAISYPNGRPHIGHAYEAIAADAIARFQRMQGREVRFLTGTDEHGLKMVQTARGQNRETRDLADEMSGYFRDMCAKLNISIDRFVRTTAPEHHSASQALWARLQANDDLYLDRYEGWYSVRDEAFYDASELVEGPSGNKLSPQGTPVEWTVEETWFFRLSKYQDALLKLYADEADFIRPESRRNEVIRFVEGGLRDLSVSRTSFDWGVKVPGNDDHVMYVWLDALTAYLSGIGFPDDTEEWQKFWPASLHLIGKDIVRFHAVYWPAFLMSAGIALPKAVFGHGFLLARDGAKISKSAGNVVDPMALAERYGVDAFRYFLLREVNFGQDGSWSEDAIVTRCNAELSNSFGNLAQRTLSLIVRNCGGRLPLVRDEAPEDDVLLELVGKAVGETIPQAYDALALSQGAEAWLQVVFACNAYIDAQAPWALKNTDTERMETVLATLYVCIAQLAVGIAPLIPASAGKLLDQMGVPHDARTFGGIGSPWYPLLVKSEYRLLPPQGLFPRLELSTELLA